MWISVNTEFPKLSWYWSIEIILHVHVNLITCQEAAIVYIDFVHMWKAYNTYMHVCKFRSQLPVVKLIINCNFLRMAHHPALKMCSLEWFFPEFKWVNFAGTTRAPGALSTQLTWWRGPLANLTGVSWPILTWWKPTWSWGQKFSTRGNLFLTESFVPD